METATQVTTSSEVKLGLWLSRREIWVKGMALNGVVINNHAWYVH